MSSGRPTVDRLLIVGFGSIGQRHARLAREVLPTAKIGVLRHAGGAETLTGIDSWMDDIDDALRWRPQAAVLANPSSHRMPIARRLARAGVHLLLEKPISDTVNDIDELLQECRRNDLTVMTGYNLRFSPTLAHFRQLLLELRVGRVLSVRAEVGQFLAAWRPDADYRTTVSARAALGGGVLLELSHEIDYLRWIFGEVEWVNAVLRRQSGLEIDVEDTAHLVLGFSPAGEASALVAALNMDFVRHDPTRTCTAIGESGSLRWDAHAGTVDLFEPGADTWRTVFAHPPQRDETYTCEWQEFLARIADGRPPLITGEDGLAALRVVDSARQSSATGATVRVSRCAQPSDVRR